MEQLERQAFKLQVVGTRHTLRSVNKSLNELLKVSFYKCFSVSIACSKTSQMSKKPDQNFWAQLSYYFLEKLVIYSTKEWLR